LFQLMYRINTARVFESQDQWFLQAKKTFT